MVVAAAAADNRLHHYAGGRDASSAASSRGPMKAWISPESGSVAVGAGSGVVVHFVDLV